MYLSFLRRLGKSRSCGDSTRVGAYRYLQFENHTRWTCLDEFSLLTGREATVSAFVPTSSKFAKYLLRHGA